MNGPYGANFSAGGHNANPKINRYVNRTGATLLRGQTAMVDLLGTQAESTSIEQGAAGSCQRNLTPVTQAGCDAGFPIVVVLADVLDNAEVDCLEEGYVDLAVQDDDVSSITLVDRGDPLIMVVSRSAVAAEAQGAAASRSLGIAMEDAAAATDSSATQIDATTHRRRAYWWGGRIGAGVNNA